MTKIVFEKLEDFDEIATTCGLHNLHNLRNPWDYLGGTSWKSVILEAHLRKLEMKGCEYDAFFNKIDIEMIEYAFLEWTNALICWKLVKITIFDENSLEAHLTQFIILEAQNQLVEAWLPSKLISGSLVELMAEDLGLPVAGSIFSQKSGQHFLFGYRVSTSYKWYFQYNGPLHVFFSHTALPE